MAFNPMMIPRMGGMQSPFGGGANPGLTTPQMAPMQGPSLAGRFDPTAFLQQANAQNAQRLQEQQRAQWMANGGTRLTGNTPASRAAMNHLGAPAAALGGLPFGMGGTISSVLGQFPQTPQGPSLRGGMLGNGLGY